ncbi:TolB family protein [Argonema galeatum]|uniref:TolB family protein n=1 Tax=Argonema galeatum TaxID=2942762 RepID=UPI0020119EF6|nr:biopolymer transporter Tol [Argonema galeatum]MCL1463923.1 biopolymer transporter Tol [Argonema galeatum A003/A1]
MPRTLAQQWLNWGMGLSLAGLVVGCSQIEIPFISSSLNSGNSDEQPALSGNGRFLAFVSNRQGGRRILLYDLQQRRSIELPGLNRPGAIVEHPSLSYTGRYIVYTADDRGRPIVALYDRAIQRSQPLTLSYPGQVRNPNISPDGRYIVFESGSRGQWDIEIIDRGLNIELDKEEGRVEEGERGRVGE